LLRSVERQRGLIPPIAANNPPVASNIPPVAANITPSNPLLSSAAEPNENPLLSSITEPHKNQEIKVENKQYTRPTKPLNFFYEMKQAVLKRESGEPIRLKKISKPKPKPIENDSLQTNALLEKIEPTETVLEKAYRLRGEKIKYDDDEDNE